MKIVINDCYGGFSLSPKAIKRLAELNGEKCFFFKVDYKVGKTDIYTPVSLEEANKNSFFIGAFNVPNPAEHLPKEERGTDGTYGDFNQTYRKIHLDGRPEDRTDAKLIQVVEELGKEADGWCAELKIIEIPDDVKWEIDEYDGLESVHEVHRSWS